MVSIELLHSWKRTECFLLEARSHFSQEAEAICATEFETFQEFLEHNELGLAFEELLGAFEKSEFESWRVLELLAMAAASMGKTELQQRLDRTLSDARGWKYETKLPAENT